MRKPRKTRLERESERLAAAEENKRLTALSPQIRLEIEADMRVCGFNPLNPDDEAEYWLR